MKFLFLFFFSLLVSCSILTHHEFPATGSGPQPWPMKEKPHVESGSFVVVSDTQRTLWIERFLGREQNDEIRVPLIQAIMQQTPDYVIHLGDSVAWGASADDWNLFDQQFLPLRNGQIPLYYVMGNHDYFGSNEIARQNVFARFPYLKEKTWYEIRDRQLALFFLDLNDGELGGSEFQKEMIWFRKRMEEVDKDPSVRAILLFSHQMAFTNSTIMGDSALIKKEILPEYFKTKKALLFISGHSHGFEHFLENSKHFLVTGGGGGPRVSHYQGTSERHHNLFQAEDPHPFHFLVLKQDLTGLTVKAKSVLSDKILEEFHLNFDPQ